MADEKDKAAAAKEDPKAVSEKDNRGISASTEVNKDAKPVATKEAENVKVVAPPGTVPTSMQASGPSAPHPSEDRPDTTQDTPEMADARVRSLGYDEDAEPVAPVNIGDPKGEPIQCIAKKKFYDARGATIKAGATYFYQPREGQAFPYAVLEPVNKTQAAAARKEYEKARDEKDKELRLRADRRRAFARMAAETE